MKLFQRRELSQDEKCERARRNPEWRGDEHRWSEWRHWWRLGGIAVRSCSNCAKEEIRHADPDFLNRQAMRFSGQKESGE